MIILGAMTAFATDLGAPDSIIMNTADVTYQPGHFVVQFIHVYAVCDDSVLFFNLPLTWTSPDNQIFPGLTVWRYPFTEWDVVYDTLLMAERLLRQVAFADIGGPDNPPLLTNGQRLWVIDLRFLIQPNASQQFVVIDTIWDPRNGLVEFANINNTWHPKVKAGYLRYGIVGIDEQIATPTMFALNQNYPNPFNPETNIDFQVPTAGMVNVEIFNVLGQRVKTLISEQKDPGYYSVHWNGTNENGEVAPTGVYFYRMTAEGFTQTNKMVMLR